MSDVEPIFVRKPNVKIRPEDFNKIAEELCKGNAVLVSMKFPGSTNHVFAIEARENEKARILHAWQDKHQLRVERTMPVDEMVGYLRRLPELDWVLTDMSCRTSVIGYGVQTMLRFQILEQLQKEELAMKCYSKVNLSFFENRMEYSVLYVLYGRRIFFVNEMPLLETSFVICL